MNSAITSTLAARSYVDQTALTYLAAFGKLPEGGGLDYQVKLELSGALTTLGLANEVTTSPEFALIHHGQSTEQIIDSFYTNGLHREGDTAGLSYWAGQVDGGHISMGQALFDILNSQESLTVNSNGLARYEMLASAGQVSDQQTDIDNSPLITTVTNTVTVVDTVTVSVPAATPEFQSNGSLSNPLLLNGQGNLSLGDGTTPNHGLVVGTTSDGFMVAVHESARQSDNTYAPTNTTSNGNDISADFYLPAGTQSTANGSFFNDANHTAVSQAFMVGSTAMTFAQALAAGDTFHLQLDQDGGAGTNYAGSSFVGVLNSSGTLDWVNTVSGGGNITDNVGTTNVAGNSTLVGFHNPDGVAGAVAGDVYTDRVWIANSQGVELVGVTANEHLVAPPAA